MDGNTEITKPTINVPSVLKIRAKTVIKLQTETVNYDLTVPKGKSIESVIAGMLSLIPDPSALERIRLTALDFKQKLES